MNITAQDALAALQAMNELSQCKLKLNVATNVALNLTSLQTFQKVFNESQTTLLKANGNEDEKAPGSYKIDPKNISAFNESMKELMNEEVTIELRAIDPATLPEDIDITPATISTLLRVAKE